jgi:hypothetical protein
MFLQDGNNSMSFSFGSGDLIKWAIASFKNLLLSKPLKIACFASTLSLPVRASKVAFVIGVLRQVCTY